MTAIHPHTAPRTPPLPGLEGLVFAWDVLPDAPAVREALPPGAPVEQARVCFILGRSEVRVVLECVRVGAAGRERATLETLLVPVHISVEADATGRRLAHVDAQGVLRATIVLGADDMPHVWFARSALLAAIGFPAGTYDRPGASWER